MAKAFKCDRCNLLFEKEDDPDYVIRKTKRDVCTEYYILDLCPICQEEFENWLKSKMRDE